jgi:mannose-6-phosphate isomerase-like protein (cupin superfamily)
MKGYVVDIAAETLSNTDFRRVLYTASHGQLVVMSLSALEEIGTEVHDVDQFLRIEAGTATVVLNGVSHLVTGGSAIVVPAGVTHNVVNTGTEPLKLYTLYMPPHHKDGTVHTTKNEAEKATEHFDGTITE